jgi:hypothetical protein
MNPAAIYKQLDDYRSGKRLWGAMSAIATALSDGTRPMWRLISPIVAEGWIQ